MAGLFDLPDDAAFEVDANASALGLHGVVVRQVPDEYGLDAVCTCDCWADDGPSDDMWAAKLAELLNLEHAAIRDGYDGAADRLAHADLAQPVVLAAMQYATVPDAAALASLRAACAAYMKVLGETLVAGVEPGEGA